MPQDYPMNLQLDATDLRLLAILQEDGRISNADLAERAHLTPSTCHRRLQRLERGGVIRGYTALLEPRAVGRMTIVFVEITLIRQATGTLDDFERAVAQIPDVLECYLTAGKADYLLKIAAADAEDFARIHREHLARLPGVAQMQSSFALRTIRASVALPLPRAAGR